MTHYFSTHRGGVEIVAGELAKRLAQFHGWNIAWVASDVDSIPNDLPREMAMVPVSSWNGMERMVGIPWPIWSPRSLLLIWRLVRRADAVHLHDYLYFGNLFAWIFASLSGVPIIITQHVGSVPYQSTLKRKLHLLANRFLGRVVLSRVNQVVFISPSVMSEFQQFCCFRRPPIYLPNGVDTEIFTARGEIAKDAEIMLAREAGKRVLLFVGRFVEKKGLNILRDLARDFPDELWVFAGHGPIDPASWGLSNVLVVRGVSGQALAAYYRAADLLVLPSVGEGFPLVVQESMACGTPVMIGEETAGGCPAARHLFLVEGTGKNMAEPWADALKRHLADPDHLRDLRPLVAEFAQVNWSWEHAAAEYARLLDRIGK